MAPFESDDDQLLANTIKDKTWNLQIEDRIMMKVHQNELNKRKISNDRKLSVIFFLTALLTGCSILLLPEILRLSGDILKIPLLLQAAIVLILFLLIDHYKFHLRLFFGKSLK
ncbi:hypothetical protein [Gynurincola endophyticus]|uniref:hypothetical protein n=1 Tax=Gynurincola endophyticus TaxID=2479004 RepID=UPI000F8DB121|nr:hypothetical protein [Gynurincola endophyticus]